MSAAKGRLGRLGLAMVAAVLALAPASCGYRWIVAGGGSPFSLGPVGNATSEARLGQLLAEAFSREGEYFGAEGRVLEAAAAALTEEAATLFGDGTPVRERLTLAVEWRLVAREGSPPAPAAQGRETVTRDYPWSADPAALDWARTSTLRLLARDAARAVLRKAAEAP